MASAINVRGMHSQEAVYFEACKQYCENCIAKDNANRDVQRNECEISDQRCATKQLRNI